MPVSCPADFHVGRVSNLFGGATTPSTPETCLPDSNYDAFSPFKLAQAVAGVVFPLVSIPGILDNAPTRGLTAVEDALDLSKQERQYVDIGLDAVQTVLSSGANIMGFFDDFGFDTVVDFASDIFDDTSWMDVGGFGLDVATAFMPQPGSNAIMVANRGPQGYGGQGPQRQLPAPGTGQGGILGPMLRTGPVGRSFFNKWPNLATAIQKMRNAGQNVSRSKLYSMLKRFGPDFLVTAGILTAAGVSELALAGPGHRRMNPANSKALRRAQRRLKSFHRLCADSDVLKSRRRPCAKKC